LKAFGGRDEVPARPICDPENSAACVPHSAQIQIEPFPFRYPITSAAEYFGGIDISICTCQASGAFWYLHSAWLKVIMIL
jgi:hypothetical protein